MTPQELLRLHTFFGILSEQETRELLKPSIVKRIQRRNVVFRRGAAGDGLYGVLAGRILITIESADGKELILNSHGQGEFFGEIALLDRVGRSASAVAGETSELLFVGRDVFRGFLSRHPEAMNRIISVLCARLRRSTDVIEDAAFLNVASRLAKQLISLAQESDRDRTRGQQPVVLVSQADLAHMLGVSREFVNKQLKIWQTAAIVELGRRSIVIRDMRGLEQLVSGGRPVAGPRTPLA